MRLFTPKELEKVDLADRQCFEETVLWLRNFLGKSHADLGRTGPVCPFVPKALQIDTIRLTVVHTQSMSMAQIKDLVLSYRDTFLELQPQTGNLAFYKALLLIFPDISEDKAKDTIDVIQRSLKPLFVQQGLMIGEFHNRNESPGLHNPDFRPLRSPIPMLAIRFMAETDLPFLNRLTDDINLRVQYLQAYIQRMIEMQGSPQQLQTARTMLMSLTSDIGQLSSDATAPHPTPAPAPAKCPFRGVLQLLENWKIRGWYPLKS